MLALSDILITWHTAFYMHFIYYHILGPPGSELRTTELNRSSNMEQKKIKILTMALMRHEYSVPWGGEIKLYFIDILCDSNPSWPEHIFSSKILGKLQNKLPTVVLLTQASEKSNPVRMGMSVIAFILFIYLFFHSGSQLLWSLPKTITKFKFTFALYII